MISVIIPAYNVNQYIEQCIDSLIDIKEVEGKERRKLGDQVGK